MEELKIIAEVLSPLFSWFSNMSGNNLEEKKLLVEKELSKQALWAFLSEDDRAYLVTLQTNTLISGETEATRKTMIWAILLVFVVVVFAIMYKKKK